MANVTIKANGKVKDLNEEEDGAKGIMLPSGMQIRLPPGVAADNLSGKDYDGVVKWLNEMKARAEETVAIAEVIDCHPLEGAYGLLKALTQKYGWTRAVPTPGFWGDTPPSMLGLDISYLERVQVPWGRMVVPGVDGWLAPAMIAKDGRQVFYLAGEVKNKNTNVVKEIVELIKGFVSTESIYRGKAFRLRFPATEAKNPFDNQPRFLYTAGTRREDLIFSDDLMTQVAVNVWAPIEHTSECRAHGVPLKRGILLEGPYGTGKTLVATVTARICEERGWTFIYLEDVMDLAKAIQFAGAYSPAVIFAEDVDKAVEGQERSAKVNAILNTIDGMDTKAQETMVILTTNHLTTINQAMLRPGRLDAVISVRPPDSGAVVKLIHLYGRNLIAEHEDLREVGILLKGQIPSAIREVVERAKLAAIARKDPGDLLGLTANDLLVAGRGMLDHLELLKVPAPVDRSLETALGIVGAAFNIPLPKVMTPTKMKVNDSTYHVEVVEEKEKVRWRK